MRSYSLDNLCEEFHKQSLQFEDYLAKFQAENPHLDNPMVPGFNLPLALHLLASEIKQLKAKNETN